MKRNPMPQLILLIILLFATGVNCYSQELKSIDQEKFNELIQSKLDSIYNSAIDFGGATIGIVLPDGRKSSFSVGFSDVEEKIKMKPSDRMLGGSTGKIFVSSSIMQLVEKGTLNLDDNVRKYFIDIDWFRRVQNSDQLTIRNLLQHSSGISRYVFEEKFQNDIKKDPDRIWHPEELLSYVLDKEPLFEPGSDFAYSDTNYIILGMIIEKVTGISMYDYIDKNILSPSGIEHISPQTKRVLDGLVPGYNSVDDSFYPGKVVEDGVYKYNVQFEWAGGGYVMNTADLAAAGKLIYEGNVFSKDLFSEFFSGIEAKGLGGEWGLGVHMRNTPDGLTYGHSGFFPGYVTNMIYYSDYKFAIAIQVNTSARDNLGLFRKLNAFMPQVIDAIIVGSD